MWEENTGDHCQGVQLRPLHGPLVSGVGGSSGGGPRHGGPQRGGSWQDEIAVRRVKTRVVTLTCACCCRLVVYAVLAAVCGFGGWLLCAVRDAVFAETTTEAYYFDNHFYNYLAFLQWGDSGADELGGSANFTKAAQHKAYGKGLLDPVGWTNLCDYGEMDAFIAGATVSMITISRSYSALDLKSAGKGDEVMGMGITGNGNYR